MEATEGTLLDGRVRYRQPTRGFRSGIEPVLLAAAVPAMTGERVLEGGSGAGAALLCLAARVPGVSGVGIERDSGLAGFADGNARANGFALCFVAGDVLALPVRGPFDHALANPPYHDVAGTESPVPARAGAKQAPPGLVANWAAALGAMLRRGGTLSLILPPSRLAEALDGCARGSCGGVRVLPLWPRAGQQAKLILLRAMRGSRAPLALLAGITLHDADGAFTADTEACLRGGAPLAL